MQISIFRVASYIATAASIGASSESLLTDTGRNGFMNIFKKDRRNEILVHMWSTSAGVGLWDVELFNGDPMSPKSHWTWSDEFRRLLGFRNRNEFPDVVNSWTDRLHPEDIDHTFAVFGAALEGKTNSYDVTYRLRTRDNTYRWFRATGGVTRDRNGRPIRACGSLVDINESHQREEILDVWSSSAGVGLWDVVLANGDPMSPKSQWTWSDEFRHLLGFRSKEEFPDVVSSWTDRLHPDDVDNTFAVFTAALEGKTSGYIVNYRLRTRDNSYRWFRASGGVTRDKHGNPIRACGSLVDIQEMEENRVRILTTADQLEKMAQTLASAANSLSEYIAQSEQDAAHQASRATGTATAMEAMNSAVLEVARNAEDASKASASTRTKAEAGEEIVHKAISGIDIVRQQALQLKTDMNQLDKNAKAITQIMEVISDIADQTNLLALNAAIEAARAGEAGRGFAVVADEVRKLAEKTMSSTAEVDKTVVDMQNSTKQSIAQVDLAAKAIDDATTLINQSGEALQEIVRMADSTADQVNAIATSVEEQSATSDNINHSVAEMSDIAGRTAKTMQESAQAVTELARQASELQKLVEELKQH